MEIHPIAHIRTDFPEKFGVPRQSGLASSLRGCIVFEPGYRNPDAVRGLDGFSHIWLIWEFSANRKAASWQPTVRPPRLGGNQHMGVFATRSPFRPNPLGLSCVEIESISLDSSEGPLIHIKGADLVDNTPVYDIKPYIRYSDSYPDAVCGYVDSLEDRRLEVHIPDSICSDFKDPVLLDSIREVLSLDPRPSYHENPDREYGLAFAEYNIRFKFCDNLLEVISIARR